MTERAEGTRRVWTGRRALCLPFVLTLTLLLSVMALGQGWPRCIDGCTANDVELLDVSAEIVGTCTPGGTVEATLWASLHFNRNKTYCIRFVTDVYIDGELAVQDLVTEPFNMLSKGTYSDVCLGSVTFPCASTLTLENIKLMWSVDSKLDPASNCQDGTCTDYGPGSKCAGDQFTSFVVTLPLDAQNDVDSTYEDVPVTTSVLSNDFLGTAPTSIVDLSDGQHGTTTLNGDGTITYTPVADFDGADTYSYTIVDSEGRSDSAAVTITVIPVSDPPVAGDDIAQVKENGFVNVNVTSNDFDPDGSIDPTTVTIVAGPDSGSTDVDPGMGVVTYTPDTDTCGPDVFTYTVRDSDGVMSNEAAVSVDVVCNLPPTAFDDSASTDENTSIAINVISNDVDPDGAIDASTIIITEEPHLGDLSIHPSSGVVTYTPDPAACGVDSFAYTVDDNDGSPSNEATVFIEVMCDDPPLAIDDLYTATEGTALEVEPQGILANDVTSPWEPLAAVLVSDVSHGILILRSDGSFSYIHDGSETTSDSFSYYAFDGTDDSNVATVSIVITPANDRPSALDDEASTEEDESVTIDVLKNDSDPDDDKLSVDWVTQAEHGTVTNHGTNVTYMPDSDFHGTDLFTYGVTDGSGGTASAAVTVIVASENDPPIARDDSTGTDEDTPITIPVLGNDSDPEDDALLITSVTHPPNGTIHNNGSDVTYTPDPGFSGVDRFAYTISDGNGGTDTAAVTIAVDLVNDPPVAVDDEATTSEDTPIAISVLPNDSDPDGDALDVQSVTNPNHGTAVPSGNSIVYTPDPGFDGADEFTYTVSDGQGGTSTATVTVTVAPVNDAPIAQDDAQSTAEEQPVTVDVLSNDVDPDGDSLRVQAVHQPTNGTAANDGGSVMYSPSAGFSGTDSFTYTISDGQGGTDTARVTVIVSRVNDPPIAQDDSASTDEETLVSIPVLANDRDPDGDFLLVETISRPSSGTVLNTRTALSYIPNPGFQGVDVFTYTTSDGNGGTDSATVTVSVAGVNDPPSAGDDAGNTDEGVPVTVPVLLNDEDPDGDPLAIESVGVPESGSALIVADGIEYTPNADFNGVDQFTYTVSDGQGGTATARVFIAVAGVNDDPIAQNDSASTQSEMPLSIPVLANDGDPDGDPIVIASVTSPSAGSVRIEGGTLLYVPNPGATGTDTFSYRLSDGRGGSDEATVTVGVFSGGRGGEYAGGSCQGKVIISEVAWAGSSADGRDEWLELRNLGTDPVDLSGWVLRWRPTHPRTAEDQIWKTLELTGVIEGARTAACDQLAEETEPAVRFERLFSSDEAWRVIGEPSQAQDGYFVLERRHEESIADARADLLYDTTAGRAYELSDGGDIITLIDASGQVVDTANASNLGRSGWVAGSETTFGTMERIDPLGPDVAVNWQTNLGVVAGGQDANGRPLRATPGSENSPDLESLLSFAEIDPAAIRRGEIPQLRFDLTRQERRNTGWPWISVSRPGFAGEGGSINLSQYSFAGHHESGGLYVLDIGTSDLSPGAYTFLVIYGEGEALLMPIVVTP